MFHALYLLLAFSTYALAAEPARRGLGDCIATFRIADSSYRGDPNNKIIAVDSSSSAKLQLTYQFDPARE